MAPSQRFGAIAADGQLWQSLGFVTVTQTVAELQLPTSTLGSHCVVGFYDVMKGAFQHLKMCGQVWMSLESFLRGQHSSRLLGIDFVGFGRKSFLIAKPC